MVRDFFLLLRNTIHLCQLNNLAGLLDKTIQSAELEKSEVMGQKIS